MTRKQALSTVWRMVGIVTAATSKERYMKTVVNVIGVLLVLMGSVWILQGINILPGSFMTGQTKWAIYGAIALLAGVGLLLRNRR